MHTHRMHSTDSSRLCHVLFSLLFHLYLFFERRTHTRHRVASLGNFFISKIWCFRLNLVRVSKVLIYTVYCCIHRIWYFHWNYMHIDSSRRFVVNSKVCDQRTNICVKNRKWNTFSHFESFLLFLSFEFCVMSHLVIHWFLRYSWQ